MKNTKKKAKRSTLGSKLKRVRDKAKKKIENNKKLELDSKRCLDVKSYQHQKKLALLEYDKRVAELQNLIEANPNCSRYIIDGYGPAYANTLANKLSRNGVSAKVETRKVSHFLSAGSYRIYSIEEC